MRATAALTFAAFAIAHQVGNVSRAPTADDLEHAALATCNHMANGIRCLLQTEDMLHNTWPKRKPYHVQNR